MTWTSGWNRVSIGRTLAIVVAVAGLLAAGYSSWAQQHGHAQVYSPPAGPPPVYDKGNSALDIPIELSSNHIYVTVTLGSGTRAQMILDTGGGASAFDPEMVTAAGIKLGTPVRAMGAGSGTRDAWLVGGVDYSLPGVRLSDQSVTAISFRELEATTGRRMDGVLGADFLKQFIVEIDYAGRRLHLHDPKSWSYHGTGHPLALEFNGPIPSVVATLNDSITARFHVDTGARMAVKASSPFVARAGLESVAEKLIEGQTGVGIGGASPQGIGRFGNDGVIGGDVWRRFRLILDYPGKKMYLEPNADFGQPFNYDMSGLAVRADSLSGSSYLVSQVLAGSPAAMADFQVGDRIEALDQRAVSGMTMDAFREELRNEGRVVTLARRRGAQVDQVRLTLRRLI
ncbi:MAG: PDZ/DHR/GLGF domain-containing protein [bacterium]|nr:MAG: PDZ/DHR/GLGF domain-containing protein [bacterium]